MATICNDCRESSDDVPFRKTPRNPDKLMPYCNKCLGIRIAAGRKKSGVKKKVDQKLPGKVAAARVEVLAEKLNQIIDLVTQNKLSYPGIPLPPEVCCSITQRPGENIIILDLTDFPELLRFWGEIAQERMRTTEDQIKICLIDGLKKYGYRYDIEPEKEPDAA